jgi:hypothetical protein
MDAIGMLCGEQELAASTSCPSVHARLRLVEPMIIAEPAADPFSKG